MKLLRSFAFAFNGLKICFSAEANFKIHTIAATLATALGFLLNISHTEWMMIIGCIAFVLATEMVNTAIEKLADIVQPNIHPGIKKVKDIAAGAVMMTAISSLIIGLIIFLPKIFLLIKSL